MPFQSEKQRRYLWANEPEIARDWTDTYGSRIEKNDGGIMRLRLQRGGGHSNRGPQGPGPGGQGARGQSTGSGRGRDPGGGQGEPPGGGSGGQGGPMYYQTPSPTTRTTHHKDTSAYVPTTVTSKTKTERDEHREKIKQRAKIQGIKPKGHWTQRLGYGVLPNDPKLAYDFLNTLKDEDEETWNSLPQELKDLLGTKPPGASGRTKLDFDEWSMMTQVPGYGDFLSERGKPGVKHSGNVGGLGDRYVKYTGELDAQGNKIKATDKYGNIKYGYHDKPGGEGPIYYPGYVPGGTPQGGGGGGGTTAATTTTTPSAFQESLTTGASSPFDYYVGQDPTAKNLAWGEKFGVDPRTMYKTSWAADGGRIGRAYGGIMDTETGRRAYGFGSFFKKIGRAAKKVLKSPIGKAALIGGLGAYGMGWGPFAGGGVKGAGFLKNMGWLKSATQKAITGSHHPDQKAGWLRNIFSGGKGFEGKLNPWKMGIAGAAALPFFMGGKDDDEDEGFDYEGAKNTYRDEMMRIKAGALAGTLDPNKFNFLGRKDGGRIGMYAGGQSTPSDYTMEDAMMTTTQDKLGGITDVMKQADLNRQGSVGQFYAANGGSPSDTPLMDRVKELEDEGLDFASAMAQAIEELQSREDNAQGGRIGYAGGSGGPPITMGQPIQAPQMPAQPPQRPNPMPAPQPNRMAGMPGGMNPMMGGMHPMMNRPMMNPMGGRRMAQEGGLMDLGGMEKDYRQEGGFVPLGGEEKADDVPARLSKNEFVFTADAVRGAGDGDIDKGAEIMENIMKNLEQGGQISEETQGLTGAQEMFGVSERLGEVL